MKIRIAGACLISGYSQLEITEHDQLAFYFHEDTQIPVFIPLEINAATVKNHLVAIGKKQKINVVEHLFSALYGLELYNLRIDFLSPEVPFFDGSSQTFVEALSKLPQKDGPGLLSLNKEIIVRNKDSFIQYSPSLKKQLIVEMELSHPYIDTQKITIIINHNTYIKEIAPARTFVFTDETDPRLKNLPSYGIGVTKNKFYCRTPLRFSDELVRHKVLDLLGDLFILQKKIVGKITAKNTSHRLNLRFARCLMNCACPKQW